MAMTNKEKFISIFTKHINRPGSIELLKYLENSDFFTAPASTRFHGACNEGLLNHSLKVYEIFRNEVIEYNKNVSGLDKLDEKTEESIAICGLLHDLCKVNFYKEATKNVKNEQTGAWEKVPYYTVDETFSYGHGEKSVFLIMNYIKLKATEAQAIRFHMGAFDSAFQGGDKSLGNAWNGNPLAVLLHIADLKASNIYGC
ncbi:MAG: HD domain-containing protein [Ruminococcus sp.]